MADPEQMPGGIRLLDRFMAAIRPEPARTRIVPPAARPQVRPEEILHAALHKWAQQRPEEFLAHLSEVIEATHEAVDRNRAAHPEMTYWAGYEKAIRDVRAAFDQWSQPNAGSPTLSGLQGGSDGQ